MIRPVALSMLMLIPLSVGVCTPGGRVLSIKSACPRQLQLPTLPVQNPLRESSLLVRIV